MTTTEMNIANTIAEFLHNHYAGLDEVRRESDKFLRVTLPDDPAAAPLVSVLLDGSIDVYGDLVPYRMVMKVVLRVGIDSVVLFYRLRLVDGRLDCGAPHPERVDDLAVHYQHHTGMTLPDCWKKASVLRSTIYQGHSTEWFEPQWSSPGRIVATLNNHLLKRYGFQPMTTTVSNTLMQKIKDIIDSSAVIARWYDGPISDLYHENEEIGYISCMAGKPKEWFELYDYLQDDGKLKAIELVQSNTHIGRALVWFGSNPDDRYIDRIYSPTTGTRLPSGSVVNALKSFCADNNITKTVYSKTFDALPDLTLINKFRIEVGRDADYFNHFPYVDSLRYFGRDGWLRTWEEHGSYSLDNTDGSADGGTPMVTTADGDLIPEEAARYSDHTGEWYHEEDVVYSSYYHSYLPVGEAVELYDGTFVHDDEDYVTLSNGDCAMRDDTTELWNGKFVLDEDAIELYDGDYADASDSDLVELHDGSYALIGRDDLVEVDGDWYLEGTQPDAEDDAEDDADTTSAACN